MPFILRSPPPALCLVKCRNSLIETAVQPAVIMVIEVSLRVVAFPVAVVVKLTIMMIIYVPEYIIIVLCHYILLSLQNMKNKFNCGLSKVIL